jgi:uncharacterized protein (TIGR02646 family)
VRAITKGPEPATLTIHRLANPGDYDGYADKNTLRNALLSEQRGLCCYCMCRIRNEYMKMKVEHWRCQDDYPADRLRYGNLLGACLGGEGQHPRFQCCDTKKANKDLRWNPAEPTHHIESRIWYEADGTIRSNDAGFNTELNEVLNLNLDLLKRDRKAVLDGIVAWWKLEKNRLHGPVPRTRFAEQRQKLLAGNGELKPFCQVGAWWIDMRLARMAV